MSNRFDLMVFDWNGTLSSGLIAGGVITDQPVSKLFDGVPETLQVLHQRGIFLGIATAASSKEINHDLKSHHIAKYFSSVYSADHGPLKPNPYAVIQAMREWGVDAHRTAMIGDTERDMLMAKNAGVTAIGVNYGLRTEQALLSAGADCVISDITMLKSEEFK